MPKLLLKASSSLHCRINAICVQICYFTSYIWPKVSCQSTECHGNICRLPLHFTCYILLPASLSLSACLCMCGCSNIPRIFSLSRRLKTSIYVPEYALKHTHTHIHTHTLTHTHTNARAHFLSLTLSSVRMRVC